MLIKFLSLIIGILSFTTNPAQNFEGKVVLSISFDLPAEMEPQRGMFPTEMAIDIISNKARIVQKTMMGDQIVISDFKDNKTTLLLDMGGKKIAILMGDDVKTTKPAIEYIEGSKEIAEHKCSKAIITDIDQKGEEHKTEVWYTTEIPAEASSAFPGLKGFPLEYTITTQGVAMLYQAKSVKEEKMDKTLFDIPDEYKKMTMDEFAKSMGK